MDRKKRNRLPRVSETPMLLRFSIKKNGKTTVIRIVVLVFLAKRSMLFIFLFFYFFIFIYFHFLFIFFTHFFHNLEPICGRLKMKEWEEVDRSYDMWTSTLALYETKTQDRHRARRYEGMLEWYDPLSLGRSNAGPAISFATCMRAPEAWTDRGSPDPWVDQLLLSCEVRSLSFQVPLSATLREALQLLPAEVARIEL